MIFKKMEPTHKLKFLVYAHFLLVVHKLKDG